MPTPSISESMCFTGPPQEYSARIQRSETQGNVSWNQKVDVILAVSNPQAQCQGSEDDIITSEFHGDEMKKRKLIRRDVHEKIT